VKLFPFFLAWVVLLSACAPAAPAIDDPQAAMQTMVAATVAALPSKTLPAATSTSTRRPVLPTPTEFLTATPIFTLTPVPSGTASPFPSPSETDLPIGGAEVGQYQGKGNYACMVMNQKPGDWTKVKADKLLYVVWTIKNVGAKEWRKGGLEIIFRSGDKMYEYGPDQEFPYTVAPGDSRDIVIVLRTPKKGGDYRAEFGLRRGDEVFCEFRIGVSVR